MTILAEPEWQAARAAHEARVEPWISPRLHRRAHGERHPVDDFLFEYYDFRPARLRRWHPGHGVVLAGDSGDWLDLSGYVTVDGGAGVGDELLLDRGRRLRDTRAVLAATAMRPPAFGCFGLHEWAMVYRQSAAARRHSAVPLRLSPREIDATVESVGLRCTHADAFRFFTADARPRNATTPLTGTRIRDEQPGCLHATMDLYRYAYRLSPLIGSDLIADCFALARQGREIDMRMSPYDLSAWGYQPIRIETPAGRAEFATAQRRLASLGAGLRTRLLTEVDLLCRKETALVNGQSRQPLALDPRGRDSVRRCTVSSDDGHHADHRQDDDERRGRPHHADADAGLPLLQ